VLRFQDFQTRPKFLNLVVGHAVEPPRIADVKARTRLADFVMEWEFIRIHVGPISTV
jgi:hypothetical protein